VAEFEIGVALPSAGGHASREAVVKVAQAAEELGLDSTWVPEHLLVSAEAGERYGRVLDPLAVLAYVAARTERLRLGTSVVLLPLHHPVHVAKQAATLQELSGGRFRLGIGVGWHAPEFGMLGLDFHDRGRRADEALRLIKSLWAGERSFRGRYWSFEGGYFAPLPEPTPEIWIGGTSERSIRRARDYGDVWHPNDTDPALLRRAKELWPEGRVVPRAGAQLLEGDPSANVERLREAGADGLVVRFGAEPDEMIENMRRFLREVRPH
jgi:probable F420-dependent oxidoreductase